MAVGVATRRERAELALALHSTGMTKTEIAQAMGIGRSYAGALLSDPTGEIDHWRKLAYLTDCVEGCGRKVWPPSLRCPSCAHAATKVWTRERLIAAVQEFAFEHGRPPVSGQHGDWGVDRDRSRWPSWTVCYGMKRSGGRQYPAAFKRWGDMIEAAGFERPQQGHKTRMMTLPRDERRKLRPGVESRAKPKEEWKRYQKKRKQKFKSFADTPSSLAQRLL